MSSKSVSLEKNKGIRLETPGLYNAADYLVDRNIREGRGEKTAILCKDRSLTHRQVQEGMNRFGNALVSLGVRNGGAGGIVASRHRGLSAGLFRSIKMDAVPICLNTLMRPKDHVYFLNDSRRNHIGLNMRTIATFANRKPGEILKNYVTRK